MAKPLPSAKDDAKSLDTLIRELNDRQKIKDRMRSRSKRSSGGGSASDKDILISISSLIQQDMEELADAIGPDAYRSGPISPEKYIKAAEDAIKNWTRTIADDKTIPPLVKKALYRVADRALEAAKKSVPEGTGEPFDPAKFRAKTKENITRTMQQSVANTVKGLPGMGALDAFAKFAGVTSLSDSINTKLGGVFGKNGQSIDREQVDAQAAEQKQLETSLPSRANQRILDKNNLAAERRSPEPIRSQSTGDPRKSAQNAPSNDNSPVSLSGGSSGGSGFGGSSDAIVSELQKVNVTLSAIAEELGVARKQEARSDFAALFQDKAQEQASARAAAEVAQDAAEADKLSNSPKRITKKSLRKEAAKAEAAKREESGEKESGGGLLSNALSIGLDGAGLVGGAAAGGAFAAGGAVASAVATGAASLGTALAALAVPILATAAAIYAAYEIFKRLDFSKYIEPLMKGFNILKDIVMTVGEFLYKYFYVVFKIVYGALQKLFDVIAYVLQPSIDALAPVFAGLVDVMGYLWETIKPVITAFTEFFDTLIAAPDIFKAIPDAFMELFGKIYDMFAESTIGKMLGLQTREQKAQQAEGTELKRIEKMAPGAEKDAATAKANASFNERIAKKEAAAKGQSPTAPAAAAPARTGGGGAVQASGLKVKDSEGSGQATAGGPVAPGVIDFASQIQGNIPGFTRFTGFNDNYHQGLSKPSKHKSGLAMDFTIADPSKSGQAAAAVQSLAQKAGAKVFVQDEYKNPSGKATGGHIHVQFPDEREAAKFLGNDPSTASPTQVPGAAPRFAGGPPTGDAAGTGSPSAPSPQAGPAAATRSAAAVSAGTAGLASAGAAAPMIVANIGGPSAPAAPSVTMMMPIPIPIRPRTEDMVLRAIQSVNYL